MAAGELAPVDGAAARAAHRAAEGRARADPRARRRAGIRRFAGGTIGPGARPLRAQPRRSGPLPANDADIAFAPVTQLSRWIETRKLTSERLTQHLSRSHRALRSASCAASSRSRATPRSRRRKQADAEIAAGKYRGPLHGIPYGVKDLLDTAGIPTTYGAEPFRNRVPDGRLGGRRAAATRPAPC